MFTKPLPYRGFMLDSARHFMPTENVLKIIDAAAKCGINRFHWHLTDDQGWRVEIRRYPKLTEIGSRRGKSCFWGADEYENNNGFYTQEDIKRTVAFARERGVEIVPEIEVPGHASAMLAAYPEFGCRRQDGDKVTEKPYKYEVLTYAGVFPNLISAGREDSVGFLENILEEICELFPGPEIHIGGDEAVKMHWRRCPDCRRRMAENGLKDANELQRWLVLRVGEFLKARGKSAIVWNESLAGGLLPHNFIVQHWLGNDKETAAFMDEGGRVLISDADSYYISRPYYSLSAYKVWKAGVPAFATGREDELFGLESPVWAERVTNPERAEYLLFPRVAIVAIKAAGKQLSWQKTKTELRKLESETPMVKWAPEEERCPDRKTVRAAFKEEKRRRSLPGMPRVFEICDYILLQEALERLLEQIGMPYEFAREVMDASWVELKEFACAKEREYLPGAKEMASQLKTALQSRSEGAWKGVPETIWLGTLKCFTRFVNEYKNTYGAYGFDRAFWTVRQAEGRLFRIGELEYELINESKEVYIHIPSDAVLEKDRLNESARAAREFFAARFPGFAGAPMRCETWLLSPEIKALLGGKGNIARFQKAFEPISPGEDCFEALMEWVYCLPADERKNADIASLKEDTSLRRALKKYLAGGGRVHAGAGVFRGRFE